MRQLPQLPRQSCPAGATFSEPSLRKSVATFRRKYEALGPLFSYGAYLACDPGAQVPHAPVDIGLRTSSEARRDKNIGSEQCLEHLPTANLFNLTRRRMAG